MDKKRQKKIVAASWHPGGVNAIAPVIKTLIKAKKTEVVAVGYQFSEKIFQQKGIGCKTIASYGLKDVSLGSMIQLLEAELPDLVLTGTGCQSEENRDIIEQTLTLAARKKDIKSLAVLDFWGNYSLRFHDIYTKETLKFLPDKIAIMDEIAQQAMLDEGFDGERLVITGNPYFDELGRLSTEYTEDKRKTTRSALGISNSAYLVTYATGIFADLRLLGWPFTDLDCVEILCLGITQLKEEKRKNVSLLLKKHPREKKERFEELFGYASTFDIAVTKSDYDTRLAVLASDLVVAPASTVLLEAILMGRDALSLQPGRAREDDFILNKLNLIPHAYDKEKGIELVKQVISGAGAINKYRKKIKTFQIKGGATERVAKLAHKMMGEKKKKAV